jgi:uncharacterized protein (DUF4415 family)
MKKVPTKTADLTPEMIEELEALAALPEDQIDTDDIPEAPIENMRQGVRGPYYRALKTPITIRLDADVVAWFKETAESGKYQSEINRVLRQHMTEEQHKSA